MEKIVLTRITGSILILAILASGCASSTVLRTTPAEADVYVQGQRLGETPYTYSDRKISGASTLVTFKKDGYEAYNTTIRKNKKLNVGALISGLLFVWPLFWVLGYDKTYSYNLDEVAVSTQPVAQAEPAKPQVPALTAPAENLPDSITLPTSSRVDKLLSQGQVDEAVEYADDQEGAFQAGCYYAIAQYYLDKNNFSAAKDFYARSGKINEGNARIAEALMKGEVKDSVLVIDEKKIWSEGPEMKLTAEDVRVFITVDSIVRYATQPEDLGLVLVINDITTRRSGGSALGKAMINYHKYDAPLEAVDPKLDPEKKFRRMYLSLFESKGKNISLVDDMFDEDQFAKFVAPDKSKEYFEYDLRPLKDKYNVDELMIVTVDYGLNQNYSGAFEAGKGGYSHVVSSIIDLDDNSIIYKGETWGNGKLKSKWDTPPDYEYLREAIDAAINQAVETEKTKY